MKRKIILGTVALALLLAMLLGCSMPAATPAPESAAAESAPSAAYDSPGGGAYAYGDPPPSEAEAAPDEGTGLSEMPMLAPGNAAGISLVYTVELRLETPSFMEGIRSLNNAVADVGGYTVRASIQGRSLYELERSRQASYSFKIPSEVLSGFLMTMEDTFNILGMEQAADDITESKQQTDSRLEQLEAQEARLQNDLAAARTPDAQQQIEAELRAVQNELAGLRIDAAAQERQILYSNVAITLYEVLPPVEYIAPTWEERLQASRERLAERFLAMWQNFVLFLIAVLPTIVVLLILGALAFGVVLIVRKRRVVKSGRKDDWHEAPKPPAPPEK